MYKKFVVNRERWVKANGITNVPGLLQKVGLESVNDPGYTSATVELFFDNDCTYLVTDLTKESHGLHLAAMVLRGFDVDFMLRMLSEDTEGGYYLFDKAPKTPKELLVQFEPSNLLNPDGDYNTFETSIDYVTKLYPTSYDIRLTNQGFYFYIIMTREDMDKVEENVSFWLLREEIAEKLTHYIKNKIPLEKE